MGLNDRPPRVLYLGTPGEFSRTPLLALLAARVEVCGVVVPAERRPTPAPIARLAPERSRSPLPIVSPYLAPNIVHIAWADNRDVPAAQCDLSDAAGPASNNIGNRNQNIYTATLTVAP